MIGEIITLSRLRIGTDGKGMSTLVAFWGCPLRCKYCINKICHDEKTVRRNYTSDELISRIRQDDIYFKMTGGGIVFGGGEPLLQAEYVHEVCQLSDPLWAKRIETSLYADWEKINLLTDDIDEWIIDVKDINPAIYKKYTSKNNENVLYNLRKFITIIPYEKVLVRVPSIPDFNTYEDIDRSIAYIQRLGYYRINRFTYF